MWLLCINALRARARVALLAPKRGQSQKFIGQVTACRLCLPVCFRRRLMTENPPVPSDWAATAVGPLPRSFCASSHINCIRARRVAKSVMLHPEKGGALDKAKGQFLVSFRRIQAIPQNRPFKGLSFQAKYN